MNKKALSGSDICDRFISPALERAGWDSRRWRREYGFTDGRIIVRGKVVARGKRKRADYLLFHRPDGSAADPCSAKPVSPKPWSLRCADTTTRRAGTHRGQGQ